MIDVLKQRILAESYDSSVCKGFELLISTMMGSDSLVRKLPNLNLILRAGYQTHLTVLVVKLRYVGNSFGSTRPSPPTHFVDEVVPVVEPEQDAQGV